MIGPSPDFQVLLTYLSSLGIGLLIGLERERSDTARSGLRTFALTALLGTTCALLSERTSSGVVLATGAAVIGVMMILANAWYEKRNEEAGTTTTVALLMCYGLGAIVWYGYEQVAAAVALTTTMLLYFRTELHSATRKLTRQDLVSLMQFSVITLVVLPVLPDHGYGPYAALNPYQIWLMVVVMVAVSLSGYAALRLVGERRAVAIIGILGGVASSTMTTIVFARHMRRGSASLAVASLVILTANLVVLIRLSLLAALIAPGVLALLVPVFATALVVGIVLPLRAWLNMGKEEESPALEVTNPTELPMALGVGLLFAGILLASSWLNEKAGSIGVYGVVSVMGLTDLDAVTLSTLRLFTLDQISAQIACNAIVLAYCANLALKFGAVVVLGGTALARTVAYGYASVAAGLGAGWLLSSW